MAKIKKSRLMTIMNYNYYEFIGALHFATYPQSHVPTYLNGRIEKGFVVIGSF
jgi:hypothetical protein